MMRYRKLSPTGDYTFGHGQADFYRDQREAVAQSVKTRLGLWKGQWFLDTTDGTDWKQSVLGKHTLQTYDMTIRGRILGTDGVTGITAYQSVLDAQSRALVINVTISTVYGEIQVAESL